MTRTEKTAKLRDKSPTVTTPMNKERALIWLNILRQRRTLEPEERAALRWMMRLNEHLEEQHQETSSSSMIDARHLAAQEDLISDLRSSLTSAHRLLRAAQLAMAEQVGLPFTLPEHGCSPISALHQASPASSENQLTIDALYS